jgi:hypothetical protein
MRERETPPADELRKVRQEVRQARPNRKRPRTNSGAAVVLADFIAYMPMHKYIFRPTGELWPGASVNGRIPPVPLFDKTEGRCSTSLASRKNSKRTLGSTNIIRSSR